MSVPGHPHTGLQTATWLFSGEVEHRDTTGAHIIVRPGELNLMTAGRGIAHSEYSTADTVSLHGVQLWIALPDAFRGVPPALVHHVAEQCEIDGARVAVFLGSLFGRTAPVTTHSPLVGAEVLLQPGQQLRVAVDPDHEHGVLCDTGELAVGPAHAGSGELTFCPAGSDHLELAASAAGPVRLLLLGGEPLGEQILMWWNFVARSHEEIAALREGWELERKERGGNRFGAFPVEWSATVPAPELPTARLRPRG